MGSATDLTLSELAELHINTLYRTDVNGRLLTTNESEERPAPFFYMVRTLEGNVWRFRYDVPAAAAEELDRLCRAEPPATKLAQPPKNYEAIRAAIRKHLSLPKPNEFRGP